jgi:hypothetical protein
MQMRSVINFISKFIVFLVSGYGLFLVITSYQLPIEAVAYFTTQVNILVFLAYFYYLIRLLFFKRKSRRSVFVKQALLVYVLLTMIVYAFVIIPFIRNNDVNYQIGSIKDMLVHFITPSLVFIDYLIFDAKGKFRKRNIISIFVFPLWYMAFVYFYTQLGGRFTLSGESTFPYFFFNYEVYGIEYTAIFIVGLFFLITFISWLTYVFDEILKHKL